MRCLVAQTITFLKEQQSLMGQHAPHRVLEVACSRRRSQQEVSMIELLKGSRITSSPSAAGTGPQGISQGGGWSGTRFICAGDLAKAIYRGISRRRKRDSDAGGFLSLWDA